MPRGVRWEIQDVTGADANRRLDQMSILNRFTVYVWELTRERLADGDCSWEFTRSDYWSTGDETRRSSKVNRVSLTVCSMFEERQKTKCDVCRLWWLGLKETTDGTSKADMFFVDLHSDFLKPLMEHVSLMGFQRRKLTDSPVNIIIGEVL